MAIIVVDFPVSHKSPQSRKTSRLHLPRVSRKAALYRKYTSLDTILATAGGGVFVAAGLRLPGIYRAGRPTSPIAGGFSICILWVGCGPSFRPPGCLYSVVAILSSREGMWLITGSSHICQDRFSVPTHLSATMRIGWQTYPSSRIGLSLRSSAA